MAFLTTSEGEPTLFAHRFELFKLLGSGRSASVYLARDLSLYGEEVAVKLLHQIAQNDRRSLVRLRNEVLVARRLSSPLIVQLFEFSIDSETETPYIVMEYVPGWTLRQELAAAPHGLLIDRVLLLLRSVLIALQSAHENGIVHRDVKPENVLVHENGTPKLSDFGAAKLLEMTYTMTLTEESVGSPYYMAPEQLRAKEPLPSSDVYALGMMAFELVSGGHAFQEDSFYQLALRHLNSPVPEEPLAARGAPPFLVEFISRATKKDPDDRFKDAGAALTFIQEHSKASAVPEQPAVEAWESAKELRTNKLRRKKRSAILFWSRLTIWNAVAFSVLLSLVLCRTYSRAAWTASNCILVMEKTYGFELNLLKKIYGIPLSLRRPQDIFPLIDKSSDKATELLAFSFIESGADTSVRNAQGDTPLIYAIKRGAYRVAQKLLVDGGAWPGELDAAGVSAVKLAVRKSDLNLIIRFGLIAPFEPVDHSGNSFLYQSVKSGNDALFESLLRGPWSRQIMKVRNVRGENALFALLNPPPTLVYLTRLLAAGADVNEPDLLGETVFVRALKTRLMRWAIYMLQSCPGLNIEARSTEGWTPLMIAVLQRDATVVKELLEKGADAGAKAGDYGLCYFAKVYRDEEIIRMISSRVRCE